MADASRYGSKHVVIREPAGGLAERQSLAPQPLNAHQLQLPAERIGHDVPTGARFGANSLKLPLQVGC